MAVEGDKSVSDAITDYYYFPSAEGTRNIHVQGVDVVFLHL